MPQVKLIEEWYEGSALKRDETAPVTAPAAAAAVDRLDGKRRSLLSLVDDPAHRVLLVGGGADGVYVAQLIIDSDREFFRLVRQAPASGEKKKLIVGGQSAWYRAEECCSRDEILSAAEAFIDGHELSNGVRWENVR